LAALAAVGVVSAQSSVSISGRMDASLRYTAKVAPGAANYTLTEDGGANRINFSVVEDLGGGLRAVADVGMRFGIADGLSQAYGARPLFQGETRVGLVGGFGTLKLGRGLTAVQGPIGGADPWGVTTVAGTQYAPGFASDYAAGGEGRIDQGIFYTSPNINGFTVGLSWSPRKLAAVAATTNATTPLTSTSTKNHLSVYAGYTAGPLSINAGYEQNRVGDTMMPIWGSFNAGFARFIAHYNKIEGGNTADRLGVTMSAASAYVNSGLMGAAAAHTANGTAAGTSGGVAINGTINNYGIGAVIPMGANSIRLGYSTWNGNGSAGQKDDVKLGAGIRHDLSKRTYLQANVATQTRKNNTGSRPDRDSTKNTLWDAGVVHAF
jgi:predicted porin